MALAHRKFDSSTIVIASHNAGKVREINDLLKPYGVKAISAEELNLPEPEETGTTFIANAELKAHAAAEASGFPALADDSGLCVTALNGDPGIYSARWGGPAKDFHVAMEKVTKALDHLDTDDRSAHFICALCLAWPDGYKETFEGAVHGDLAWPPRGEKGFGYDPIFVPQGHDITFGEMEPDAKHAMSHRADAFQQLIDACFNA